MGKVMDSVFALWAAPWRGLHLYQDAWETTLGSQRVISARLPTIHAAVQTPLLADYGELARMVTEKVSAFGSAARAAKLAGELAHRVSGANARALGRLTGGGFLTPPDWLSLFEDNLAVVAAFATLPATMLAPIHRTVRANEQRFHP